MMDWRGAPALAVAAGMVERDFVVANDAVVKIRDVNRAVGAELQIHRAKPRVVAAQKVRFFLREAGRAVLDEGVAIDAARHDVSDEGVAAELGWKICRGVKNHSGDGRRAVAVRGNVRREAETVLLFFESSFISA